MIINPYAFGVSYDPDAQAFFTASGLTGATNLTAINNLVVALKGYGIWTKMKAIYPFVGGTASTHKWNLVNPQDTDAAFRLVFSGGWTHSSTGAKPNGTNAFANTFLSPNTTLSLNDQHISYYTRTNSNGIEVEIGVIENGNPPITLLEIRTSGVTYASLATNAYATYTDPNSLGFYLGSRTASNLTRLFKNGSNVGSSTTLSTTNPTTNIFLGAANRGSQPTAFYSIKECAFSSIGDGLSVTEAANFYTAVQAYQTTLGRQV
jgi:hypothetical protein